MKKILFIHGMFHNPDIFNPLEEELKDYCKCVKYEIAGLDDNKQVTVSYLTELLSVHLSYSKYDLIVAHSFGAYLVLNTLRSCEDTKILLFNPLYSNLNAFMRKRLKLLKLTGLAQKFGKVGIFKKGLLRLARYTCNDTELIDDKLISGIFTCNASCVYRLLMETMERIPIKCRGQVYMIWGSKDRILDCPRATTGYCKEIINILCGHTSFLENKEFAVSKIKDLIGVN